MLNESKKSRSYTLLDKVIAHIGIISLLYLVAYRLKHYAQVLGLHRLNAKKILKYGVLISFSLNDDILVMSSDLRPSRLNTIYFEKSSGFFSLKLSLTLSVFWLFFSSALSCLLQLKENQINLTLYFLSIFLSSTA